MQLEVKIFPTEGSPKIAEKIMEIALEYFIVSCNSITFEFAQKKDANDFCPTNRSLGYLIEEDTVVIYPDFQLQESGLRWVRKAIEKNVVKVTEIIIGSIRGASSNSKTMVAFLQAVQEYIDSVNVQPPSTTD